MLKLVAFSKKRESDLLEEIKNEDRKKSTNMTYATSASLAALSQVDESLKDAIDLIFCTGEGEVAQTFEFYKNLANGERARPLVFQNSLHNSTLGALSLSIPNVSSGMTLSNGDISCEMALQLALASLSPRPILIVGTDVYNDIVLDLRRETYGPLVAVESGACAALFIPEAHPLFKSIPGLVLSELTIVAQPTLSEEFFDSYYPANGLEAICDGLKNSSNFKLTRPANYHVHVNG
ncbi:MAG: beta-ketoacyl synthase chain length factor [Bdellovibrionales bacterium]|nr:beta-ketoacyl synthase chain length factor [Bdellovibrionales bacterium]